MLKTKTKLKNDYKTETKKTLTPNRSLSHSSTAEYLIHVSYLMLDFNPLIPLLAVQLVP